MDHYISAMVSMVYEDRAKSTQGLEMPEERSEEHTSELQ